MAADREHCLNEGITATQLRVVGADGEPVGIIPREEALQMALEAELDLVEIAPQADPPVCRVMDYGKFRFEQSKKAHQARRKQKQTHLKEVKFRPGTDEGDYQIKLRNLVRFLGNGDKAKITLRFRGREMAHQELGRRLLQRIEADLKEFGAVEQFPRMEGRQMVMLVSPKRS
ncbi:MAG TPA: translation initiation factor IF-3 [Chromatiales bacterium]|nr:translation initiation factor IF-3 [Chromatiales bacterium]